jgi:hypothetical protein
VLHLLVWGPTGTDLAAQVARADFAREHPLLPYDLAWFGGVHPYGYSVLAPYVMAVLGVPLSGLVAAVAAAVLLARLLRDAVHPVAGALSGAVFSVADVVSGRTTFALGAVFALAALVLLPRRVPAGVAAVLTALTSPVAAAFLGLAAAVLVLRRLPGGWTTGLCASVPVVALALLFPSGGVQPYDPDSAPYAVVAGLALAALTTSPSLRLGGLLYAVAAAAFVPLEEPFGSNVLRLGLLLAAPLVVATTAARWRWVAPVAAFLVWWQVQPTVDDLTVPDAPPFDALNAELARRGVDRVEVVPLRDHEEASEVPPVVPLARGWSRQTDLDLHPLFYEGELTAPEYVGWLRDRRVDAVALAPQARVDGAGRRERDLLLERDVPGLRRVWDDEDWVVWEVQDAPPLADPPVEVLAADRTGLRLRAPSAVAAGTGVRWSRWLSVDGPACVERAGESTRIRFSGPGEATLTSSLRPAGHCPDGG